MLDPEAESVEELVAYLERHARSVSEGVADRHFQGDERLEWVGGSGGSFRPFLKKNLNASRPSEHTPVRGESMPKRLGGIIGCKDKSSSWRSTLTR